MLTFQEQANTFALSVINKALPIIPQKLLSGSNFATFAILGSTTQVKTILDYVQVQSSSGYRRPNPVTLLAPRLYVTKISNALDIRGSTCIGGIIFKSTTKELQRSIKIAVLSAKRWDLGEVLIEPDADKELEFENIGFRT